MSKLEAVVGVVSDTHGLLRPSPRRSRAEQDNATGELDVVLP
jgi:hypothetical protein